MEIIDPRMIFVLQRSTKFIPVLMAGKLILLKKKPPQQNYLPDNGFILKLKI